MLADVHGVSKVLQQFVNQNFPSARHQRFARTYYSDVAFLTSLNGRPKVIQELLPYENHCIHTLEQQRFRTQKFINTLVIDFGVVIPDTVMVIEGGHLIMVEDYAGVDLEVLFFNAPDLVTVTNYLEQVLHLIRGVLEQNQAQPLVGLDLQLSNFCADRQGTVTYIDPYPPLIRIDDTYHVHWPEITDWNKIEQELDRKWRICGTLRRLHFDVIRINPQFERIFIHLLHSVLGNGIATEVAQFLAEQADARFKPDNLATMSYQDTLRALEGIPLDDKDTWRAVAARLVPMGPERQKDMTHVFSSTRSDPSPGYEGTAKQRTEALIPWLLKFVE